MRLNTITAALIACAVGIASPARGEHSSAGQRGGFGGHHSHGHHHRGSLGHRQHGQFEGHRGRHHDYARHGGAHYHDPRYRSPGFGFGYAYPYAYPFGYSHPYQPYGYDDDPAMYGSVPFMFVPVPVVLTAARPAGLPSAKEVSVSADSYRARIQVIVPRADAEVWVDGQKTDSGGTVRVFESPELDATKKYTYITRASWAQDGRSVTEERTVQITVGTALVIVDFTRPRAGEAPPTGDLPKP